MTPADFLAVVSACAACQLAIAGAVILAIAAVVDFWRTTPPRRPRRRL